MIAILLFVQILSNGFAQIPNIDDDKTLDTDVEIPSLTSARNNTSCGSNSSLTDLWASTDSSTWGTWTNAVYGYYDVNCTVIGNNYTLEATIEITSQQTANGSAAWSSYSFWNWSETNNHEYMSEAWSNLTAGETYCVNATLWDVSSGTSTYVDSDYPCFTLTNSSGGGGNNTGGNNTGGSNNSNCGNYSNLTDMMIWTDATTYTVGDTVYMSYDVNCTILGNNYTIDSWLRNTTSVLYGGSPWFGWTAQWNPMQFSDYNANFDAGDYCLNATLYEDGTFLEFEETCFTIVNGSSSGNNTGGNNSGGNNSTSNAHCLEVNNATMNQTYYVTVDLVNTCSEAINYPGINAHSDNSEVSGLHDIWWYMMDGNNSTFSIINMGWQLTVNQTIQNGTVVTLYFGATILNCGSNNSWAHDCPTSTLSYQFTVYNNNTGGNSNCGNDSNLTDLMVWTDATTYTVGDNVLGNFFVNCTLNGETYHLDYEVIEFNTNIVHYDGEWNWTEQNNWEAFNTIWAGLPAGEYCIHSILEILTSTTTYSFVDYEATCFDVWNSTGGNNTGGNNNSTNPCGTNSSFISVMSWTDSSTYQLGDVQTLNFYVNCTIIGNDYTLEYYVTEVGVTTWWSYAGSWTWTAGQTYSFFTEIISGLGAGDYCVIGNLYESNSYAADDGGNTCFTILAGNNTGGNNTGGNNTGGNNTGGNNTGGNNTWASNATLDVDLAYNQVSSSYDTEQWMMVDQMNSGSTYEVVWTLDTCNGFNWMDSGTWSFTGVANQAITDFSIQPGWNCLVLEGELFENGNPVDWDMDTVWCNCSNGLNTTSPANNTPPQVSSVMISPSWATETDVLTCTYVYSDLENDPDMSTITWTISGVPTTTVGPTLSSGFVAGDFVTCVVSSFDGTDYGNVGSTTSLIMTNSSGSSGGGGGGLPSIGVAGTIAAISAGFIFAIRREDEE